MTGAGRRFRNDGEIFTRARGLLRNLAQSRRIYLAMATTNLTATSLPTRQLGNSDLNLTRVGFGAWAIGGGDWEFSWGPQDDADSITTIERAIELGINW